MELIENYLSSLQSWTRLSYFNPIYDTNSEGTSVGELNAVLANKKNILIVIETVEGYVFGAFIEKDIPFRCI